MSTDLERSGVAKVPLSLTPSVLRMVELYSEKEGMSLNQFISDAVAEKLAHLKHEEWVRSRPAWTPERAERAISLLNGRGGDSVEPGDELPEGYTPGVGWKATCEPKV